MTTAFCNLDSLTSNDYLIEKLVVKLPCFEEPQPRCDNIAESIYPRAFLLLAELKLLG